MFMMMIKDLIYDDDKGSNGESIGNIGYITPIYSHDKSQGYLKLITNWPEGTKYTNLQNYVVSQLPTLPSYLSIKADGGKTLSVGSSAQGLSFPNYSFNNATDDDKRALNGQTFTYHIKLANRDVKVNYVDDEDNAAVSSQTLTGNQIGSTINLNASTLAIPANYELDTGNTSNPSTYTLTDGTDQAITIYLKHKVVDDTDAADTQQNRMLTVNYVNSKTGEAMSGLTPAKLQVHFKRTAKKDLVTGQVSGDWYWDNTYNEDGFSNGYKVISGTWTTPSSWAAVTATVPTIDGYTAFTSGDWETNKDGTQSSAAANSFVFPTWNNSKTSNEGLASKAYLDDAVIYEATPTHTVYYVPTENESRTITEHFTKLKQNADGSFSNDGQAAPDAQLQVFFDRTANSFATNGSTDPTKWITSYNSWQWDSSAGDEDTPGYKVISGNEVWAGQLGSKGHPNTGPFICNDPTISNYTVVTLNDTGSNTSDVFSHADPNAFTTNTGTWFYRNELTTYYVPSSILSKTVTRTINTTGLATGATSTTQSYTFKRTARINSDDTGVVLGVNYNGGFKSGNDIWNNVDDKTVTKTDGTVINGGSWASYGLTQPGYTATETINGTDQVVTSVPAVNDLTADTKDQTVNITYIKNAANVTISGDEQDHVYNGSQLTVTDDMASRIGHDITKANSLLTLPDGTDKVTFNSNDFSFVDENGNTLPGTGNPQNVGTYHIILNDSGLNKLKALDANYTWSYDPKTSYVVFKITKAQATVNFANDSGQTVTYNGQDQFDTSKFTPAISTNNGQTVDVPAGVTLSVADGDFAFNGTAMTAEPTDAGTYTVTLSDKGFRKLESATNNYDWVNSASAIYKINKANATVNFANGSGQNVDYTGQNQFDVSKFTPTITTNNGQTLTVPTGVTLSVADGDFAFNGTVMTTEPTAVGTYTVTLSDKGFKKLQSATNNYDWVNSASAIYNIDTAVATAKLTGSVSSDYTGEAITIDNLTGNGDDTTGQLTITITGPTASLGDYTLQDGDVEFSKDGTTWTTDYPTDVNLDASGNVIPYQVRLSEQGINNIKAKYGNNNIAWTDKDGKSTITSDATYTINKKIVYFDLGDSTLGRRTYNGLEMGTSDSGSFSNTSAGFKDALQGAVDVVDANGSYVADISNGLVIPDNLTAADFDWTAIKDTPTLTTKLPVNNGLYKGYLNQSGIDKFNKANPNLNVQITSEDMITNHNLGGILLTMIQAHGNARLTGSASRDYNGQEVTVDDLNNDGNITLTLNYPYIDDSGKVQTKKTIKLSTGDYTWDTPDHKAPTDYKRGGYKISLNKDAIIKLIEDSSGKGAGNKPNVTVATTAVHGTATFTINKVSATATLANVSAGNYTKVYDGQATSTIDASKLKLTTTVNGQSVNLNTTGLTDDSYEWVDASGNALTSDPKNVGTYYIKLKDSALATLQANNKNFTLTSTGLGVYTITQATGTATLSGSNSKTYDGSAVTVDQVNSADGSIKVALSYPGAPANATYTLVDGDYTWNTSDGKAPKDYQAGGYQITLTSDGIKHIQAQVDSDAGTGTQDGQTVSNVVISDANTGSATFIINQSANTVSVNGEQDETYDNTAKSITYNANGTNSVTVSIAKSSGNTDGAVADLKNVTLNSGDFHFVNHDGTDYTGSTADAGTYYIALTTAGVKKIQDAVGNNYIVTAKSTSGKMVIAKATGSATFSGSTSDIYTGVPKDFDSYGSHYSVTLNAPGTSDYTLQNGDVEFKVNGTWTTTVPTNVGTYNVRLSQQGWNNIKKLNTDNINWDATVPTSLGIYTITQATATASLSGSNSKTYGGSAVTVDQVNSNGSIKVTLTFPGSNSSNDTYTLPDAKYYTWNTSDGKAPTDYKAGGYTITLTSDGIKYLQGKVDAIAGSGTKDGQKVSNVVLSDQNTGSATFTINKSKNVIYAGGTETETYTGEPISVTYNDEGTNSVNVSLANASGNNGAVATLTADALKKLSSDDFEIVDGSGNPISATDAGTYKVILKQSGLTKLQNAIGDNYDISIDNAKNDGSLVIKKADVTVTFSGTYEDTFSNKSNDFRLYGDSYAVTITAPGTNAGYALTQGDIEFRRQGSTGDWSTTAPKNAGTYDVQLTQQGWDNIRKANSNNINWPETMPSTVGTGTYIIDPASVDANLSGKNSMTYTGHAATTADLNGTGTTIKLVLQNDNINGLPTITLSDGDYDWYKGATKLTDAPKDVGNYTIKLNSTGLARIQQVIDSTLGAGNVTLSTTDDSGSAEFDITQAVAENVQLYGNEQSTYNGSAVTFDPTNADVKKNFGFNNSEGLTIPDFASTDFDWVDENGHSISTPINQGTYYLQLNDSGKNKLADANPNYSFVDHAGKSTISGKIKYVVNPKSITIGVNGTANKIFDGSNAKITQDDIDNGNITLSWGDGESAPSDWGALGLTPDDFEVVNASGNAVSAANSKKGLSTGNPVYYVRLSEAGQNKLAELNTAHHSNYTLNYGDNTATYLIYQRQAQLTLTGIQTTVYGTVVPLDLSKYTVDLSNWADDSTKPTITLQDGDLAIKVGNELLSGKDAATLPTDVGSYSVVVTDQLMNRLRSLYGDDYDFDAVTAASGTESGDNNPGQADKSHQPATYVITPAEATVTINGAQHIKYGQDHTIKYGTTPSRSVRQRLVDNLH